MKYSLVDFLIGPQYPDIPPIVVGALGEVGLWLADGDRAQAERELVAALPDGIIAVAYDAGYTGCLVDGNGDPIIVTCMFAVEPDAATGWPWPKFVQVVRAAVMEAFMESRNTGGVLWYARH